jgi:type I restriction enzyme S subunit
MTQTQKQNVPKLRFPEFEGDWQKRKLGELGPVSMCKRVMKDETKPSGDVPFYKIGTFGREPDAFIDRELFDRYLERYPFPKTGDVLISAAGTIGRLVVYDGSPAYFQDSNIVWVANDERDVSNKFLLSCYQNTRWTTEDTTIARLYNDNLRNIDISAPTLPEQRKIARFLSAVDTKIAQLAEKKHLLEDYKKGCMQRLFSQRCRFKDENGDDFPDWDEMQLGSLVRVTTGSSNREDSEDVGEYAFFDRSNDVRWSSKYLFDCEAIIVAGEGKDFPPRYFKGKFDLHQRAYAITNFESNSAKFLFYWINWHRAHFLKFSVGSTMPSLRMSAFEKFPVALPHPNEQRKIAEFLSALDHKIELVAQELTLARSFKAGLLQQMFV